MKQINVVARRNEFLTARITEVLAEHEINIESIDVFAVGSNSVVTMTTKHYDEALDALRVAGLEAVSEDALLIRVPDEPGSLAKVAGRFRDGDIHLRSLRNLRRDDGYASVAVSVDRTNRAMEILQDLVITEEE